MAVFYSQMLLPENCSFKVGKEECPLPPSYVVSIKAADGEYMVAVVCEDHKEAFGQRLAALQKAGSVPAGAIHFEPIKAVVTDCVTGMNEDYVEVELNRGIDSDRKI